MKHLVEPNVPTPTEFYPNLKLEVLYTKSNNLFLVDYLNSVEFGTFTTFDIIKTYGGTEFYLICLESSLLIIEIVEIETVIRLFSLIFRYDQITNCIPLSEHAEQFLLDNCECFKLPPPKTKNEVKSELTSLEKNKNIDILQLSDNVEISARVVAAYYIRRNYYQSSEFIDPSFFIYDEEFKEFDAKDFIQLRPLSAESLVYENLSLYKPTGHLLSVKVFLNDPSNPDNDSSALYEKKMKYIQELQKDNNFLYFQKAYGFVKQQNSHQLIFQFMANGNINRHEIINPTVKTNISLRILSSLSVLHCKGLIHGDLKSDLLYFDHNFKCFIGDPTNSLSFNYAAPEQAISSKISYQSDLYSFGMILYQLATGNSPFHTLDPVTLFKRIQNWNVPPLSSEIGKIIKIYNVCTKMDYLSRSLSFYLLYVMLKEELFFAQTDIKKVNLTFEDYQQFMFSERKDLQDYINDVNENNVTGLFFLGNIYQIGLSVPKDETKSKLFYQKSWTFSGNKIAHQNMDNPESIQLLEEMDNSLDLEIKSLINESRIGVDEANTELGIMYETGRGVEKNYGKAIEFLQKAEAHNYPPAIYHLGSIYEHLSNDSCDFINNENILFNSVNMIKAVQYYQRAAKLGCDEAKKRIDYLLNLPKNLEDQIEKIDLEIEQSKSDAEKLTLQLKKLVIELRNKEKKLILMKEDIQNKSSAIENLQNIRNKDT
ncbi:hypothetical protein TRFO_29469 [Tritrichomonas foetus]|uniref:Protein kinase domain-containing protein n=1 Tax=Tritrichomonas foetus TaxID=1144522 RepID=A0A1J4JX22_9EUKA|nr:hypothetical protein TRFO_29469 [Tritrichomonas foetus]|eukprot:OHT03218.1 hypothetical protein TRFO_29469 [Tritrichomonas foetus]